MVFNFFVPLPLIATHYNPTTPNLKLKQSEFDTAVYIKYLLVTPTKMIHDLPGVLTPRL